MFSTECIQKWEANYTSPELLWWIYRKDPWCQWGSCIYSKSWNNTELYLLFNGKHTFFKTDVTLEMEIDNYRLHHVWYSYLISVIRSQRNKFSCVNRLKWFWPDLETVFFFSFGEKYLNKILKTHRREDVLNKEFYWDWIILFQYFTAHIISSYWDSSLPPAFSNWNLFVEKMSIMLVILNVSKLCWWARFRREFKLIVLRFLQTELCVSILL